MKLELSNEFTITDLHSDIGAWCRVFGRRPEYIDMTLRQYERLCYLSTGTQRPTRFDGILILVQGHYILDLRA